MTAYIEERYVYESLTRYNYFPNQKDLVGEMPPIFSTTTFTPEISEKIISTGSLKARKIGFDYVTYSVTRHNNVPRALGLMHPVASAHLARHISANWGEISWIKSNECSVIRPAIYTDGRIVVMNYEDSDTKTVRALVDGFGKRFRVETDISGCFSSVYTHSIPWAVVGFDESKKKLKEGKKAGESHWSDDLDYYQRNARRGETQGIPIGPASSTIIVELILGKVDKALVDAGYTFRRYIDDYICSCSTYEEAQEFIRMLGVELAKYKLGLNLQKTKISGLPEPVSDLWVSQLGIATPNSIIDATYGRRKLLSSEVIQYLDFAVRLNSSTPDGSVLKYAVASIVGQLDDWVAHPVFVYVLNLSWHYPVLIPYLEKIVRDSSFDLSDYVGYFNALIIENAKNRRSDGMVWPLYYLIKYGLEISQEAADALVKSEDCVALSCLFMLLPDHEGLRGFVLGLQGEREYVLDQYWLLLYQFYCSGIIENPYSDNVFPILKDYNVNFIGLDSDPTLAEQYCDYLNNPFRKEGEEVKSLDDFIEAAREKATQKDIAK
ncbi:antiviral reverse transcriptase Drt4 [Ectopseudomonas mendocina]|uniref:antiviral reverse transcriptase Drt4 n=1 Tax=Ectopseudomonas mendocina TaxID=300 RepID=UPI000206DC61|nr:antiviral reverse transcriptase Drt4 [Pseudomonas mendocina]AEB58087.1 hypothetical protein MDS_2056 [Pseudomonas mendocina NK-01]